LIKIASLKDDLIALDLEKTTAAQPIGVPPFQYRPVSVLEDVLNYACHLCPAEYDLEHAANLTATTQRVRHYLMVDGIGSIEIQ
jgi:hypothetical protein